MQLVHVVYRMIHMFRMKMVSERKTIHSTIHWIVCTSVLRSDPLVISNLERIKKSRDVDIGNITQPVRTQENIYFVYF
jgi:hypothetical protein